MTPAQSFEAVLARLRSLGRGQAGPAKRSPFDASPAQPRRFRIYKDKARAARRDYETKHHGGTEPHG